MAKKRPRSFGKYLSDLRSQADWSLRELAKESGLSLTRLWNLEQDNHSPTLPALLKLSDAFGMSLTKFVAPLHR